MGERCIYPPGGVVYLAMIKSVILLLYKIDILLYWVTLPPYYHGHHVVLAVDRLSGNVGPNAETRFWILCGTLQPYRSQESPRSLEACISTTIRVPSSKQEGSICAPGSDFLFQIIFLSCRSGLSHQHPEKSTFPSQYR